MQERGKFPDFLCIGVGKSGTTWLYRNLRRHPEVGLLPLKELQFFGRRDLSLAQRWRTQMWRTTLREKIVRDISSLDWRECLWNFRYVLMPRTDDWYASLYGHLGDDLVLGDITPGYAVLDRTEVEHIADIMPAVKIILLLRNPIDRAFSQLRMDYRLNRGPLTISRYPSFNEVPLDAMREHFEMGASHTQGEYAKILSNWRSMIPRERLLVGFMDEIENAPANFLNAVATFLGIEQMPQHRWPNARKRYNTDTRIEMPAAARRYLARKYLPELRTLELNGLIDDPTYVTEWRMSAEGFLTGSAPGK